MNKVAIIISLILATAVALSGCATILPGAETPPETESPPTPAEEAPAPAQPTPPPLPPPTQEKPKENLITDLAYMRAGAHVYSDDADPDWEGSEINLLWYDSKSNLIFTYKYKDIVLDVSIEIFASKAGEYPPRCTESVYKDKLELTFPFDIRIPFEDMNANPQTHICLGIAKIVVHTPQQGDFSIEPAECGSGDIFVYPP